MQATIQEAKEKLTAFIYGLEEREFVTITRDGQPIARITAVSPVREPKP